MHIYLYWRFILHIFWDSFWHLSCFPGGTLWFKCVTCIAPWSSWNNIMKVKNLNLVIFQKISASWDVEHGQGGASWGKKYEKIMKKSKKTKVMWPGTHPIFFASSPSHFSIPGGTGFLHAAPGLDQLRKTLLGDGFVNWGDFWQAVWLGWFGNFGTCARFW